MNLQDSYLNQVRKEGIEVKVALCEGTLLRGFVRGFDNFTVVLQVGGIQHLIYKHAIAQIVAKRAPRPPQAKGDSAAPDAAAPESSNNSEELSEVAAEQPAER
jgi:host factor-I protein